MLERILREANTNPDAPLLEFTAFYKLPQEDRFRNDLYKEYKEECKGDIKSILKNFGEWKDYSKIFKKDKWVETFQRLFGENAVIASHDSVKNQDADLMGYVPVKMNSNIANHLIGLGITSANKIKMEQDYRWASEDSLTTKERARLSLAGEINRMYYSESDVDLKVYDGLFTKTGREIEQSEGVQVTEKDGRKSIGIKRALLTGEELDFARVYIHELGHAITGVGDYDRRFTDFFVRKLAERTLEEIKSKRRSSEDYCI